MEELFQLKWSNAFSVGNELIDEHHQTLFKIINHFEKEILKDNKDIEAIAVLFDDLKNYTLMHFGFEEDLMASRRYKAVMEHKELHLYLKNRILHYELLLKNKQPVDLSEVVHFLQKWIIHHVLVEDKKYSHMDGIVRKGMEQDIAWSDEWLVGDADIDKQHQFIFDVYLKIKNHELVDMQEIVEPVVGHINRHFESEEKNYSSN